MACIKEDDFVIIRDLHYLYILLKQVFLSELILAKAHQRS